MKSELQNVNELKEEFRTKKKELSVLRSKLNALDTQKEKIFRELRSTRDKIKARAGKIKDLKKARDKLTKQVREVKGERDKLNLAVKEKAGEKKKVDEKKSELMGKMRIKSDPSKIKREIDQLEVRIETEAMPFSQEQKLRKSIKELKVKWKELEKLGDVWKEIKESSSGLSEARKKAEETHKSVQSIAHESQEKHEDINKLYEELKELRVKEQPLAEEYLKHKVEFEKLKKEVDEINLRVTELGKVLNIEEEKSFKSIVKEKTKEVKEKIRKGKKLSTEDILAFQAIKD